MYMWPDLSFNGDDPLQATTPVESSKQLETISSNVLQHHVSTSDGESMVDGEVDTSEKQNQSSDVHEHLQAITSKSTENSTDMQAEDLLGKMPDDSAIGKFAPLEVHTDDDTTSAQVSTWVPKSKSL